MDVAANAFRASVAHTTKHVWTGRPFLASRNDDLAAGYFAG
jgi:hypothetical protein